MELEDGDGAEQPRPGKEAAGPRRREHHQGHTIQIVDDVKAKSASLRVLGMGLDTDTAQDG